MDQEKSAERARTIDYLEETELYEAVTISSWEIKNFNCNDLGRDIISSSEFPCKLGKSKFNVCIEQIDMGFLSVYFGVTYYPIESPMAPMGVEITEPHTTVTLRNKNGLKLVSKSGNFEKNQFGSLVFGWLIENFWYEHNEDVIDKYLKVETKVVQPYHITRRIDCFSLKKSLVKDLLTLYESKELTDATIEIRGRIFPVHKSILCARSKVFKAMFSSEMIEGKTNHVQIDDIEPDVFEKLLRYICTDEIGDIEGLHLELAYAADKYGLEALKIFFENELLKGMNEQDALKTFEYADSCGNQTLKDKTRDYIVDNIKKLPQSDIDVLIEHPEFVTHVIATLQTFKSNE